MVLESFENSLPNPLLHMVSCLIQEIQHLRETIEFYELNFIETEEWEVEPDMDESEQLLEEQLSEMPCV